MSILRALKTRNWGAGEVLNLHDRQLRPEQTAPENKPFVSIKRSIPIDWIDYNGHMNESRYGQVFSDAADAIMEYIGADQAYIESGLSYFTVETRIRYLDETKSGERIYVNTQVLTADGKKLKLLHEMHHIDGRLLATGEQMLIHVDLNSRRACLPQADILAKSEQLAAAHKSLPKPDYLS